MTSCIQYHSKKTRTLLLVTFVAGMLWTLSGISILTSPAYAIQEQSIPLASCIYNGQEYPMNAHIASEDQKLSRIDFPELPDNYQHQMIVEQGKTVTIEFDGDKPSEINAFLVDYDADITETYPLKKVSEDTFELTQAGIKTLEVIASFSDDTQISYTLLVDVKDST